MDKGYLSIGKTSTTGRDDFVSIHASTMKAGEPGVVIRVSIADFAEALFGRGMRPCEFGLRVKD